MSAAVDMLAWCAGGSKREPGGPAGSGVAGYPQAYRPSYRHGMSNAGPPYQGCLGPGMNYADRSYENQMGSHCQTNSYPSPYHSPSPYRPHPVSPPAHYGGHGGPPPPQSPQQHPPYANGPPLPNQSPSMAPYGQQQYNLVGQGDSMYPRHVYPTGRMKPGAWGMTPESSGGGFPPRPPMMGSPPPQMRSTPGSTHGYRPGPPQSPSWAQSPRTTPSPLAGHARSPVQPFSPPPTPALTPQLKPPSPAVTQPPVDPRPNDPLQSLQKMVMLDSADTVDRYDVSHPEVERRYEGTPQPPVQQSYVQQAEGTNSPGSPYPTYYNLDQNRLCTPPRSIYGNICGDIANYQVTPVNGEASEERTGSGGYQTPVVNGGQTGPFQTTASRDDAMQMEMQFPPQSVACVSANSGFVPESSSVVSNPRLGEVESGAPVLAPPRMTATKPNWPARESTPVFSKEDPTKRRRSSDSVLCGDVARPEKSVQRRPRGGGAGGRGRRRSTASLPEAPTFLDGAGSGDAPMPIRPSGKPHPDTAKAATEDTVAAVDPATSAGNAAASTTGTSGNGGVKVPEPIGATSTDVMPPKKKRGRPFGSKNKKKEDGSPLTKAKRGAVARRQEAPPPAPPTAPPTMQAPPTTAASKPPRPLTGPYVHVVGTRERPISSYVVNTVCRPEEEGKRKKGAEQGPQGGARQHPRRKMVGGHTSTLSPNYDAFTRDPTWLCALCHKGSHFEGLGDLFGPYSAGEEPGGSPGAAGPSGEGGSCRGRGKRRRSEAAETVIVRGAKKAKQRRPSDPDAEEDRTAAGAANCQTPVETDSVARELWIHEDCAVWTQGVYLVGHRIRGLEEAVREAQDLSCSKCKLVGATLACVMRGCGEKFHYLCAVERGCQLDPENFSVRCPKHKKPSPS